MTTKTPPAPLGFANRSYPLSKRGEVRAPSLLTLAFLSGCATIPEDAQFSIVADQVQERSGLTTQWQSNAAQNPAQKARIQELLNAPLSATSAVQIALLNNPGLQAKYAELGISQADLVQAGLYMNPTFSSVVGLSKKGVVTDLDFNLLFNFLHILTTPLRAAIAESEFKETQLKMIKLTLDFASDIRKAYYQALATGDLKHLYSQGVKSAQASSAASKALRDVGNISALQKAQEEAFYEQTKADYLEIEVNHSQALARLGILLGLTDETTLCLPKTLPTPPRDDLTNGQTDESLLEKNIDLGLLKQRLETLAHRYHVTNATALIPEFKLGASAKYQNNDWDFGPAIEFTLPLFDQGEPALAKARFTIQGVQKTYAHTTLQVHSMAKTLKEKIAKTKQREAHYRNTLLPLTQRIIDETQLHYNAMQVGVFNLIQSKQKQIDAKRKHTEALLDYWLTRSDLEQLIQGSLPSQSYALKPDSAFQTLDPEPPFGVSG